MFEPFQGPIRHMRPAVGGSLAFPIRRDRPDLIGGKRDLLGMDPKTGTRAEYKNLQFFIHMAISVLIIEFHFYQLINTLEFSKLFTVHSMRRCIRHIYVQGSPPVGRKTTQGFPSYHYSPQCRAFIFAEYQHLDVKYI